MDDKIDSGRNGGAGSAQNIGNAVPPALDAPEFARESAVLLARIEQGIIDANVNADADFVSDGVLEVEFENGGKMIVNRHEVSREIWLAGRTGAHHFFWDGTGWFDTRSGEALMAVVSDLASQIAGRRVVLR